MVFSYMVNVACEFFFHNFPDRILFPADTGNGQQTFDFVIKKLFLDILNTVFKPIQWNYA